MATILGDSGRRTIAIADGWTMAVSSPDEWATPAHNAGEWIPARVPGTATAALEVAGRWQRNDPEPLHDKDVWFRVQLPPTPGGILRFGGLATIAEVWIDVDLVLRSDNMFVSHQIPLSAGLERTLSIVCRSLTGELARRSGKRARWRTQMIPDAKLRFVRTTLLGHMPGWCPPVDTVGPWLPVDLIEGGTAPVFAADVRATLDGDVGCLSVRLCGASFETQPSAAPPDDERRGWQGANMRHAEEGRIAAHLEARTVPILHCAGSKLPLTSDGEGGWSGMLKLPNVAKWWPHTHGEPALHAVAIDIGTRQLDLGRVGFRRIVVDRGSDGLGFAIRVNDMPVFCRGAVWMPPDIVDLSESGDPLRRSLSLAVEAGLNMLRVSGTTTYQPRAFHDLCDELGILVWQDLMFANFDYPADDPVFADSVSREMSQLLDRLQTSPSLAILCGGSEVAQQAAMTGLPPGSWANRIIDQVAPDRIETLCSGTPFVASSPFGGDLPFQADVGCTHYFGVGAYRRPLDDARRAHVRFASECLAFANCPDATSLAMPPVATLHDPAWKDGIPRDLGASWDFQDVRDHYLALLYEVDPSSLRNEDTERYLRLSRAVVADVIGATFAEWRRPASPNGGALIWTWQDLRPGTGWGVVDAAGRPKSAWYALARASKPIALFMTDEGVNGLHLHGVNDTGSDCAATLTLTCLRSGHLPVASASRDIVLPPRSGETISSAAVLGRFFDVTYAYRFGSADHDVCDATLTNPAGRVIAEAQWWLPGKRVEPHHLGLSANVGRDEAGWYLRLGTGRAAASITIDDPYYRSSDNHFDLVPGRERLVRLLPLDTSVRAPPRGQVSAINAMDCISYAG